MTPELHPCPCDVQTKCAMTDPCLGCEIYSHWIGFVKEIQEAQMKQIHKSCHDAMRRVEELAGIENRAYRFDKAKYITSFPLGDIERIAAQWGRRTEKGPR